MEPNILICHLRYASHYVTFPPTQIICNSNLPGIEVTTLAINNLQKYWCPAGRGTHIHAHTHRLCWLPCTLPLCCQLTPSSAEHRRCLSLHSVVDGSFTVVCCSSQYRLARNGLQRHYACSHWPTDTAPLEVRNFLSRTTSWRLPFPPMKESRMHLDETRK